MGRSQTNMLSFFVFCGIFEQLEKEKKKKNKI